MRGPALVLAVLTAPLLAGCLAQPLQPAQGVLDLAGLVVPEGAVAETLAAGVRLVWDGVELPFQEDLTVPAGVTLVRTTGIVADELGPGLGMWNTETGRRRCNNAALDGAWDLPILGRKTCSGYTAVDVLPAEWTVRVTVPGAGDPLAGTPLAGAAEPVTGRVEVEFLTTPVDGIAAGLNLAELSQPVHDLLDTEVVRIASHDGAMLYAELTRPDVAGPVPTIITSSPYNGPSHQAGLRSYWTYAAQDWAKRGYAFLAADVRGYGESEGCVEVWSLNEQLDQKALVEWVAEQEWSDGKVGFYGQSYDGTTPTAAAVHAPEALKAIVTIAPVINAYDDWHFGGVPNGENSGSPVAYQQIGVTGAVVEPTDPLTTAMHMGNGLCDPTLVVRANDPRAIYDAFYAERNFSAKAQDVTAAVLYTQGFEDSNVKSAMITHWFNALQVPKLGLFGHWVHQHPTRADQEVLFLAWFDQFVKGKPMGFEALPAVDVVRNDGTHRTGDSWPPLQQAWQTWYADFGTGAWADAPADGMAAIPLAPTALPLDGPLGAWVVLERELAAPLDIAGLPYVHVRTHLEGGENAYLMADVYDVGDDAIRRVTWGMVNLAHRDGHDQYAPVPPGEVVEADLPLLPTEYVVPAGHTLQVVLRAAHVEDWSLVGAVHGGRVTLHGGETGVQLVLPLTPAGAAPAPLAAQR